MISVSFSILYFLQILVLIWGPYSYYTFISFKGFKNFINVPLLELFGNRLSLELLIKYWWLIRSMAGRGGAAPTKHGLKTPLPPAKTVNPLSSSLSNHNAPSPLPLFCSFLVNFVGLTSYWRGMPVWRRLKSRTKHL